MRNIVPNEERMLNEILFENRNRNYGAYVLRSEADRVLTKSMFLGIGVFAFMALTPLMINVFSNSPNPVAKELPPPYTITRVVDPPDAVPDKPAAAQSIAPVQTLDSRVPTPAKNPPVEQVMPKQADYDNAVIGTRDIIGDPPVISNTPPVITVEGPTVPTVSPKPVDNSPKTIVDVQANFTGGINAFRNKVVNQFDTSVMDGTENVVKTTLIFIVEKDGTISEVQATGPNATFNREAVKTIKAIKGKWIPAKLNGENVRSYFKFPISMQFE